ncbi:MAG: hypothetical protein GPJ21_12225 [Microcystis aeruginosa W13-11]|nr:hypothetical protein [Microcystis aeruginosa W13-11]
MLGKAWSVSHSSAYRYSLAKIISTIFAIASFLGFSLPEKFPPTPCQPTAIVETTEVSTNN